MKQIKLYFCPRCKSKEVRFIFAFRNIFGIMPRQKCSKCGFEAMSFPIAIVNFDKLNKKSGGK